MLAGNLRRLREEAGTPVEEIVKAAGVIGLEWTPVWLTPPPLQVSEMTNVQVNAIFQPQANTVGRIGLAPGQRQLDVTWGWS